MRVGEKLMINKILKEFNPVSGTVDIYRRLVESLHVGIYVTDPKGTLVYVNSAFVNILGYASKDEVIGLNLAEQLYVHPQDREEFMRKMERLGFVRDYELLNKRKDGSVVLLSVTSSLIYGESSDIVGVEGVIVDVTAHKKMEQELVILRNAVEQTADHVMITDKHATIQYVNPAFEKTTGYTRQEAVGKNPRILKSGLQPLEYYQQLWKTILAGKTFYAHTTNKKKSGELYIADQTISPIVNEAGEIINFVSIWKDVTEKDNLEERLRIEKQKLEEIIGFDEKISAIRKSDKLMDFVVEKTMRILEADTCLIMLLDQDSRELCVKASSGDYTGPLRINIADSPAGQVIKGGKPLLVNEGEPTMIVPIKRDGEVVGVITVANKRSNNQSKVFTDLDLKILLDIAREVAVAIENINFYKELQYLTITDPLTNIHNFRHFAKTLDYEIKRSERLPEPLSLLMIDIDNFKSYNDQFGHHAGDQFLIKFGQVIQANLREVDIFCRYGGDEFVVILPGADAEGCQVIAQRIRKVIEELKLMTTMTVSIGATQFKKGMTRNDMTLKADCALYQAKKEGKNRVCIFS
jgi:diguanylate cyclase (GGDEF)-like protein/PAS domain S-box-containing protein